MSPRSFVALCACAIAVLCVAAFNRPASAVTPPLASTIVQSGFTKPVFITHAPGDFHRLFIVEQTGKIKIIKDGVTLPTEFLNTASIINAQGLEQGLLMLAFHPNYQSNGVFYTYYTAPTGVADPLVSSWTVTANPDVADFNSRQTILHIPYNIGAHRAGWMDFDPNGYLYISTGDGGETDPQNNGSNLAVIKGKVLRIDINGPDGQPRTADDDGFPADPDRNYQIPPTNPFVSTAGAAPEIWAYGLRNPWRCSFDRLTRDFWIGDVGQNAREEVDFVPAGTSGAFLGWRCMEANNPTNYAGCTAPLPPSIPPVYDYPVSAVIGGYVYRGCAIPDLQGKYMFADWNSQFRSFRYSPGAGMTEFVVHTTEFNAGTGIVSTLGEDAYGELYFANWSNGVIRKIVPASFTGPDCNANSVNDACDIAAGTSSDINHNGIPDECETVCTADIDGSGNVDVTDLLAVITNWGPCPGTCPPHCSTDIVPSCAVDVSDLLAVITGWGPCR